MFSSNYEKNCESLPVQKMDYENGSMYSTQHLSVELLYFRELRAHEDLVNIIVAILVAKNSSCKIEEGFVPK